MRFYDRQFITCSNGNEDIHVRFDSLPDSYLNSEMTQTIGSANVNIAPKSFIFLQIISGMYQKRDWKNSDRHEPVKA
jgi:hypothetical protein